MVVEVTVVFVKLIHVFQINRRSASVFQGPVVVPVENHPHFRWCNGSDDFRQTSQFFTQFSGFPEDPRIFSTHMFNHRTMEFFTRTDTATQLEKLDGIGPVSDGLIALRPHLTRFFQRVVSLPVLLRRCLFHQHKWLLVFHSPHQIMGHSDLTPRGIVGWVIVPRNDIQFLGPFEVVQAFVSSHQIGGDGSIFVMLTNRCFFQFEGL